MKAMTAHSSGNKVCHIITFTHTLIEGSSQYSTVTRHTTSRYFIPTTTGGVVLATTGQTAHTVALLPPYSPVDSFAYLQPLFHSDPSNQNNTTFCSVSRLSRKASFLETQACLALAIPPSLIPDLSHQLASLPEVDRLKYFSYPNY